MFCVFLSEKFHMINSWLNKAHNIHVPFQLRVGTHLFCVFILRLRVYRGIIYTLQCKKSFHPNRVHPPLFLSNQVEKKDNCSWLKQPISLKNLEDLYDQLSLMIVLKLIENNRTLLNTILQRNFVKMITLRFLIAW